MDGMRPVDVLAVDLHLHTYKNYDHYDIFFFVNKKFNMKF